ncbi:MAG: hypothetical protein ABIT05_04790 [Chitinophagaceae bacterium]
MKSVNKYFYGLLCLLTVLFFTSCEKSFDTRRKEQTNLNGSTIAQVHIAMAGAALVGTAGNQLMVDANQITGAALISGSVFPSTGYGFVLAPGIRGFTLTGPAPQPLITFAENMQAGKHHTIFIYDTITSPKQKTVVDNIIIPADTTARLRFANFIYNPYAVPAVDVFSWRLNTNMWTNIPTTGVTDYATYPSYLTDTLYIRETGTQNLILKVTISGGVTAKRSYTLSYRGSYRGTRAATLFANY